MKADDDIELQHARKLNLVLRRMRAELNDESVQRLLRWVFERNGITVVTSIYPVPDPRRQPPMVAQLRKQREQTDET